MRGAIISVLFVGALAACGESGSSNDQKSKTPVEEASPSAQAPATASVRPAAFGLCAMCHSDVEGKKGLGPSLHGIIGREAGSVAGFAYSPAMKASNLTWDGATLDQFMQNPREIIPGTRMTYPGLKDAQKRAEIVRYLETLK